MTLAEAKIYLPFSDDEEIKDVYEEKLFEFKQFFLSQTPIAKVFQAKIRKLEKLDLAYETLTEIEFQQSEQPDVEFKFSDEVLKAFHYFEQQKNEIRLKISGAKNGSVLQAEIRNLLNLVTAYQQKWAIGAELELEVDALSREPDAMEILRAMREFSENGGIFFKDILEQKSNLTLLKEMKRVSLLLEKY